MLTGSVIDHKINDYANTALMALLQQLAEVCHSAVIGVDRLVIGDVVAVVGR